MKIKSVTPLNDGICEQAAEKLWSDIEGFAAYSFNKSHAAAYSLIAYQSMFLKVNHPLEFYAATMTALGEDKLTGLMRDAKAQGVSVFYPDINRSSDRFELDRIGKGVIAPFQRIKGVSTKGAAAILKARASGRFTSMTDFLDRVEKKVVNKNVQEALNRIGAFASVEPTQVSQNDPSRIRDQMELLPGLVSDHVPVDREMHRDKASIEALNQLVDDYRHAHGPGSANAIAMPVKPHFGKTAKVMVVFDAPNGHDEGHGIIGHSDSYDTILTALEQTGLTLADLYMTALIKRPKAARQVSSDEIALWKPWFEQELEILKPTAIVLMGTQAVRTFLPAFKGKASDAAGEVVYFKDLDANVVIGFSPGEVFYSPEKQELIDRIFTITEELT